MCAPTRVRVRWGAPMRWMPLPACARVSRVVVVAPMPLWFGPNRKRKFFPCLQLGLFSHAHAIPNLSSHTGGWLPSRQQRVTHGACPASPPGSSCQREPSAAPSHSSCTPCTAVLIAQPDVAGRACTVSGRRERKRRRCRPRRHRSQKCGHCVHRRQPPELSSGPSPACPTCQII